MASSDIYEVNESPWQKKQNSSTNSSRRRRRGSRKTFDEAVHPDFPNTHHRRHRNSGLRRFRHLMKRPEFSRRFWGISISVFVSVLLALIIWDRFFRYPDQPENAEPTLFAE
jgi:hypothetical protein